VSIKIISAPLSGEQVLQLSPADANEAALTWLRRPNLFPGRALTAPTLDARSRWASGHVVLRAQAFTPGVVEGLEVGFVAGPPPPETPDARAIVRLHVGAGRGLAVDGEDVWLAGAIEADLYGIPVVTSKSVIAGGGAPGGGNGTLAEKAIGPSLGQLLESNPAGLPPVGVLLLQPVSVDVAEIDPEDPCDRCGCAEGNVSYEDWRIADASCLLWYAWPEEWRELPPAGPRFRNALAHSIFDAERVLEPDAPLPWEEFGVPIALFGVDEAFVPLFCDKAAVARVGGRAQVSRLQLRSGAAGSLSLDPRPRLAPLWQAQIEQLAGQIADLGDPAPPVATLAAEFGRLPPCGLLPTSCFDLGSSSSGFFPPGFDLDAVPVPVEQLDLAIRETASLAPLDFSLGERVRILVPVSQASWEPRLLIPEDIDPLFAQTLNGFLLARSRALGARQGLRVVGAALRQLVDATPPAVPDISSDADALEVESFAPWGPPPGTGGHRAALIAGLHQHLFDRATATLTPAAGESLYVWVYLDPDNPPRTLALQWFSDSWEHRVYWGDNTLSWGTDGTVSRSRVDDLPETGRWLRLAVPAAQAGLEGQAITGMAFTLYDGRAAFASTGRLVGASEQPWFATALPTGAVAQGDYAWDFLTPNALWAPFEPAFGLVIAPPSTAATPPVGVSGVIRDLIADSRLTVLSSHERGELMQRGLQGFIDYLASRADRADDVIDYGFVKVQTDVYRVRQLVLNTTAATKLAVSPVLASIAQAETAVASQEQISTFFDKLKATKTPSTNTRELKTTTRALSINTDTISLGGLSKASVIDSGLKLDTGVREVQQLQLTGVQQANLQLDTGISAIKTTYTPIDITNASPLVGNVTLRTLSIAERLGQAPAQEARDYASSSRQDALHRLLLLADALRDEDAAGVSPREISGLFSGLVVFGAKDDPFLETADMKTNRRRPLADFLDGTRRASLLELLLRPIPRTTDPDEGLHFSDATDTADTSVALLRQVEGRVKQFRDAIIACKTALASIQADISSARASEAAWSEKLAETRHDVAVTRALIDEEEARLAAINARRAAVLASEVRFIAYMRPRDGDNLIAPPVHVLDPALTEAPVPACLREHPDVPDELAAMLAVLREAPAAWFGQGAQWFDGLNRVDFLVRAVQTAQVRTQISALTAPVLNTSARGVAGAIANITARHTQTVSLARNAALSLDLNRLSSLTWQGAFQQSVRVVSLGDLISGEHGNAQVSRRAADFYERFASICTCLHAEFSGVPPAVRLTWATQLSEFDTAPNLRNLASLPQWASLDSVDRRQMQAFADWLFSQASSSEERAQALVNDVVRMCLLIASHAPVDRIIAGRLPRPVTARPGLRIPLVALDPSRLRIGMHAVVYRANQIVARAVVEDLGSGEASARVLTTAASSVELDESVRVQFSPAMETSFVTTPLRLLS